jgi:uncharacterized SAM-binding protein YcdF (DUF218 family)
MLHPHRDQILRNLFSLRFWIGGLVLAIALTAAGVGLFPGFILPAVARWLDVGQRPAAADYVMIMPGGEETRPFVAAGMVRRGMARTVLVPTTVDGPLTEDGVLPPNHQWIRKILNLRGVEDDRIVFLDQRSGSSWNDAQALADYLASDSQATVAVVTNDFHTRRARWVFRRVLGDRSERLFLVSAPSDRFTPDDWWRYRRGVQTYLGEYAKLIAYVLLYGGWTVWIPIALSAVAVLAGAGARYWYRPEDARSATQTADSAITGRA